MICLGGLGPRVSRNGVARWRIASRDWPPLKATRFLTVPKHPMQNLWHAIEPKFLAEGVAPVSQDRRRGAGSFQLPR